MKRALSVVLLCALATIACAQTAKYLTLQIDSTTSKTRPSGKILDKLTIKTAAPSYVRLNEKGAVLMLRGDVTVHEDISYVFLSRPNIKAKKELTTRTWDAIDDRGVKCTIGLVSPTKVEADSKWMFSVIWPTESNNYYCHKIDEAEE